MVKRILIANNGMAAMKFLTSMKQGRAFDEAASEFEFFGMVSPEDLESGATYVEGLDYIILVPSGPSVCNYSNVKLIVESAVKHECDAVWPGWGHASENFELAQALELAGICWIGPSWESMKCLGDKIESLLVAQSCGVPCVAWSGVGASTVEDCCVLTEADAVRICKTIGYPVMLKASSGGGGRGIRRVDRDTDCASAFRQVVKEVNGSGGVFAMKCVDNARHVEVQIIGDGRGKCVALGTRDCSVQRRHQKLVEEGPAPFISPSVLREMESAAERLCASVNYGNAGTVEFLYVDNEYYFLEVNCRLQVEHPVTELLWGINLPKIQVQVAFENFTIFATVEKFRVENPSLRNPTKHVVGCRIVAEDPSNGWLPSSGSVNEIIVPAGAASAYFSVSCKAGGRIHQFSDSQFGHVFCVGENRADALANLHTVLNGLSIVGSVGTNLEYMTNVVLAKESKFVKNGPPGGPWGIPEVLTAACSSGITSLLAVCAYLTMSLYVAADAEILRWVRRGHRAPHAPANYSETLVGPDRARVAVVAARIGPNLLSVSLNGGPSGIVGWIPAGPNQAVLQLPKISCLVSILRVSPVRVKVCVGNAQWHQFEVEKDLSRVIAPMNGKLLRWLVAPGIPVVAGEKMCEIEAMKMLSVVHATVGGCVAELAVPEGVSFIEGDCLAILNLCENGNVHTSPNNHHTTFPPFGMVLSVRDQVSNILDGYDQPVSTPTLLCVNARMRLVEKFLADEALCEKWIVDIDSALCEKWIVADSAPNATLLTVWRHRLGLSARMRFVCGLIDSGEFSSDWLKSVQSRLNERFHGPVINALEEQIAPSSAVVEGVLVGVAAKRAAASAAGSFYIYDLPALLSKVVPHVVCEQLFVEEHPGVGMVAWMVTLYTPEAGVEGRRAIFVGNDISVHAGSFSVEEDLVYLKASALARELGLPRIYIACNSGARLGLAEEVQRAFRVRWTTSSCFDCLYLLDEDYQRLSPQVRCIETNDPLLGKIWVLTDVLGVGNLGVENLMWSGAIAGESSRAYDETFTLTYVTGRTVGIGAYIARLCQRIIQKTDSPILLTGFQALNKLIGSNVYRSNDEIGGTGVMYRNGVSHLTVETDLEGIAKIVEWLQFLPKRRGAPLLVYQAKIDPPNRLLNGAEWKDLFDRDSFVPVQTAWGQSVIVGRARLGGIPIGVVVVETRQTHFYQPADPADPDSQSIARPQAGQVWYPDSAYKTAQAIEDFNREELPLIILANWRGFSGGQRDMFNEILKFGSFIVDALRTYKRPVFVYLPPKAELRGGAWVVIDARINPEMIEMYADPTARGGVLEPSGTIEIKFRHKALFDLMLRSDPVAQQIDTNNKELLNERFSVLKPTLIQIASTFADMHDTPNRMLHTGAISAIVEWKHSRSFFYRRLKERLNIAS